MKIKTLLTIIAIISLLPLSTFSKNITAHRGVVANGYNFWLAEPQDTVGPKPVVIFLHGRSLCGNDLNTVKRYGVIDAVEKGRDIDAYVLAPQNPGSSWNPEKIMNILEWVEKNRNIDPNRIYVLGMSLGGYGTLDFAAAYPDRIAAAIAMCGGATKRDLGVLNNLPLWIIHGTGDAAVPVSQSDKVVNEMRAANPHTPRLKYDRIPGMNHSQPARVFYMADTYDWLLSHSLKDEGRPIAKTFDVSAQMGSAYQGLNMSRSKSYSAAKTSKASSKKKSSKKASASTKKTSAKAKTSKKKSKKK